MKKFKRQEGFRFVFNIPLDAQFSILVNGSRIDEIVHPCKIIDVSPRGMKIFTESDVGNISEYAAQLLELEMQFVLDVTKIKGIGQVRWSKRYATGIQFGLYFRNQPEIEELIINEMKRRRKKEVLANKQIGLK